MAANAQLLYADLAAPTHSGSRDRPPTLHGQRRSRSNISHINRGTWRGAKHIFTDTANATARAAYLSQRVRRRTHLSHRIRLLRPESKIARPPHSQITFHSPARLHSHSHVLILIISLVFALVIVIVLAPALALGALLTIGLAFLFLGQEAVLALVDAVQHLPALGRAYVHVEHAIADGV